MRSNVQQHRGTPPTPIHPNNDKTKTTHRDVPTKELLVYENNKAPASGKFIIQVLDDTRLFVKADRADYVRSKVQEFNERNVYQPPADKDEKEALRR